MTLNEADTRAKIIDPKLHATGWQEDFITREYYFTEGKIYLVGDEAKRKESKKILILAVVHYGKNPERLSENEKRQFSA